MRPETKQIITIFIMTQLRKFLESHTQEMSLYNIKNDYHRVNTTHFVIRNYDAKVYTPGTVNDYMTWTALLHPYMTIKERQIAGIIDFKNDWGKQFYAKCLEHAPANMVRDLMAIFGVYVSLYQRLEVLMHNHDLFLQQFTIKKHANVPQLENYDIQQSLSLFSRLENIDNKHMYVLQFCEVYKVAFKRIESQNILQAFLKQHIESQYHHLFAQFLKDCPEDNNYASIHDDFLIFKFDKKKLFSRLYHNNLMDKDVIYSVLGAMEYVYKKPEIRTILFINDFHIRHTDNAKPYFLIILESSVQPIAINQLELIDYILSTTIEHYSRKMDIHGFMEKAINAWLLSQELPITDKKSTKVNKI